MRLGLWDTNFMRLKRGVASSICKLSNRKFIQQRQRQCERQILRADAIVIHCWFWSLRWSCWSFVVASAVFTWIQGVDAWRDVCHTVGRFYSTIWRTRNHGIYIRKSFDEIGDSMCRCFGIFILCQQDGRSRAVEMLRAREIFIRFPDWARWVAPWGAQTNCMFNIWFVFLFEVDGLGTVIDDDFHGQPA